MTFPLSPSKGRQVSHSFIMFGLKPLDVVVRFKNNRQWIGEKMGHTGIL